MVGDGGLAEEGGEGVCGRGKCGGHCRLYLGIKLVRSGP